MGGFLGDIFGGKKAPPPPPQLEEAAGAVLGIANEHRPRLGQQRDFTDKFLKTVPEYTGEIIDGLELARLQAQLRGEEYGGLWDEYSLPALQQQGRETLAAGSEERQRDEGLTAREILRRTINENLQGRKDSLYRRGITEGGAIDDRHTSVQAAVASASAENQARLQERNYGENVRRNYAPNAMQHGQATYALPQLSTQFQKEKINTEMILPNLSNQLFNNELDQAGGVSNIYGGAVDHYSTVYNAKLAKAKADRERQQAIAGGIGKFAGIAVGAFTGGAGAGAGAGAAAGFTGGGGGGWGPWQGNKGWTPWAA